MASDSELLDAVEGFASQAVLPGNLQEPGQYSIMYAPKSDTNAELFQISELNSEGSREYYDAEEWLGGLAVACKTETTPEEVSKLTSFLKGRAMLDFMEAVTELRGMIKGGSNG